MDEKAANHSELRMALIFRGDLDVMTRGKSEGQAAHAGVELAVLMMMTNPDIMRRYMDNGQPKIVLETPHLDGLNKIITRAHGRDVPIIAITDAARTCFTEPTMTCVLIGPMSKTDSNAITRGTIMRDRDGEETRTLKGNRLHQVRDALAKARSFIVNGVALGFIRMPDDDVPDTAHQALPMIDAAIAIVE